jgi:predicted alpha/beta-fold hydrolase
MNTSSQALLSWAMCFVGFVALLSAEFAGTMAQEQMAPAKIVQGGIVKLPDSNIEYFTQGNGEPIVLLPFGGLTVGYLEVLSRDLAQAGYRVIRINFRGSGRSTGSGQGVTLHTLAGDVAGVIQALQLQSTSLDTTRM